jgi:hypothetical protein
VEKVGATNSLGQQTEYVPGEGTTDYFFLILADNQNSIKNNSAIK